MAFSSPCDSPRPQRARSLPRGRLSKGQPLLRSLKTRAARLDQLSRCPGQTGSRLVLATGYSVSVWGKGQQAEGIRSGMKWSLNPTQLRMPRSRPWHRAAVLKGAG